MTRTGLMALAALTLFTAGCAQQPVQIRDPNYAPVRPGTPGAGQAVNGSIYQAQYTPAPTMVLFEDLTARRVGDVLTIALEERTDASKSASTSTAKDQSVDIDEPTIFGRGVTRNGLPVGATSIAAGRAFDGEGSSSQSNSLEGSITVTVAEVLANGNLVVRGEKVLSLNQGDEFIRFSGIVRPSDIRPDNSVLSTKVANAEVTYGGTGALADANAQGWLGRFFNSPFFPF